MSWHGALGLCVGLLLPLPLVLLLGGVMQPRLPTSHAGGRRISPVLGFEERLNLQTYHRDCMRRSDCEPPLGCLLDGRSRAQYCTDSQCLTDDQCPQGEVCQSLGTSGGGPLVRFCIPLGVRQEGEQCIDLPDEKVSACLPGLLCAGHEGWCARPCRIGEALSCPEGFFCADVVPQPVCLPTCEARGCPQGQQCVKFEEGASACAVVYGPNCQRSPCPDGRECDTYAVPSLPGRAWMECIEFCGEDLPACTNGRVCDRSLCMRPCNPEGPNTCGEGYRCKRRSKNRPWVCEHDDGWPDDP